MQISRKALLLALGLSAVLLLAAVPAADARHLKQASWSGGWGGWGSGWGGPFWGGGWGRQSDPVGSGCWDGDFRYRTGESIYTDDGCKLKCDWGEWVKSCHTSDAWSSWARVSK